MDQRLRQRLLVELLENAAAPVSSARLAAELTVSQRTIHNDLRSLKALGVNVQTALGRQGGFWIPRQPGPGDATPGGNRSSERRVGEPAFSHRSHFVGRTGELARAEIAIGQVLSGTGRLLLLSGEPGIGKTRLCQQVSDHALRRGLRVLWSQAYEDGGAPPLWPWIQVLRSISSEAPPELGETTNELLAQITPEKAATPRAARRQQHEDSETARFRLFDAITSFLRRAAEDQPLALVIEDLQWADESTLKLLEFVSAGIANSKVMVLGTFRNTEVRGGHPLDDTLAVVRRTDVYEHLQLDTLSRGDVTELVEEAFGSSLAPEVATSVFDRSEGNALFATEIVRLMVHQGAETTQDPLPPGVKQVIRDRLGRVSGRCARLLTNAAILDTEFDIGVLSALDEGDDAVAFLEAVDEAMTNRLLEEASRSETLRFSHGLVRETLVDDFGRTDLAKMHARAADVLERRYGAVTGENAAELANHLGEARPLVDDSRYVMCLVIAGNYALDSFAFTEARVHFEKAVEVAGREAIKEAKHFDAAFGLARALMASGDLDAIQEGVYLLDRVFTQALDRGDIDRAIEVASIHVPTPAQLKGVVSVLERALKLAPPGSATESHLLSEYAEHLYYETADAAAANDATRRAIEIAEALDDDQLLAVALTKSVSIATHQANLPRVVELAERAVQIGARVGNDYCVAQAGFHLASKGAALGRPEQSKQVARLAGEAALRVGLNRRHGDCQFTLGFIATLTGDWETARRTWDEIIETDPLPSRVFQFMAITGYLTGDDETARSAVDELVKLAEQATDDLFMTLGGVIAGALLLRFEGDSGYSTLAKSWGELLLEGPDTSELLREAATAALGWIAVLENDEKAATAFAEYFEGGRTLPIGSIETVNSGHVLAMLHRVTGDFERAADRFEQTAGFLRSAGYRPELALVLADHAELLLELDGPRERQLASEHVSEASEIAGSLGMTPLAERLSELTAVLSARRTSRTDEMSGLTVREIEVLRLVASGMSTREVAESLVISRHTVTRHLANIFAKTGVSSRSEATALAVRQGIG